MLFITDKRNNRTFEINPLKILFKSRNEEFTALFFNNYILHFYNLTRNISLERSSYPIALECDYVKIVDSFDFIDVLDKEDIQE